MKKPILLFALKCTAIMYFVVFADVSSFTNVDHLQKNNSIVKQTQGADRMDEMKESHYLSKL